MEKRTVCPICSNAMNLVGIGSRCPNCGYAHIPSPVTDKFKGMSKTATIILIVVLVILVYVVPNILEYVLQ